MGRQNPWGERTKEGRQEKRDAVARPFSAGPGQGGIWKPGPQIGQGCQSRGGILLEVRVTLALGQSDHDGQRIGRLGEDAGTDAMILGKNNGGPIK
jgi:hypothetical protein